MTGVLLRRDKTQRQMHKEENLVMMAEIRVVYLPARKHHGSLGTTRN